MSEELEKVELSVDDLDAVSGGGMLQIYYDRFRAAGGVPPACALLPKGKKVVVNFICDYVTEHVPDMARYNKDYSQKVYGMLPEEPGPGDYIGVATPIS